MKAQSMRVLRPLVKLKVAIIIPQGRLCWNLPFKISKLIISLSLKFTSTFKKTVRKPSLTLGSETFKVAIQNISIKYLLNWTVQNSTIDTLQSVFLNKPKQVHEVSNYLNPKLKFNWGNKNEPLFSWILKHGNVVTLENGSPSLPCSNHQGFLQLMWEHLILPITHLFICSNTHWPGQDIFFLNYINNA